MGECVVASRVYHDPVGMRSNRMPTVLDRGGGVVHHASSTNPCCAKWGRTPLTNWPVYCQYVGARNMWSCRIVDTHTLLDLLFDWQLNESPFGRKALSRSPYMRDSLVRLLRERWLNGFFVKKEGCSNSCFILNYFIRLLAIFIKKKIEIFFNIMFSKDTTGGGLPIIVQ